MKLYKTAGGVFLAALMIMMCACTPIGDDAPAESSAETTVTTEAQTTEAPEKIYVSPLATEDFLLPLDDFSWEREFDAEFVMLHFTSAVMVDRNDPYNMDAVRKIFVDGGVSINYIIERDGTIRCYIPEDRAAWHAGKGTYGDDEKYTDKMNKYSIGIEIVAIGSGNDMAQYLTSDEYDALNPALPGFTDAQYTALSGLLSDICERNGIPKDRHHVIGHEEYSEAKSDPGELFDWNRALGE